MLGGRFQRCSTFRRCHPRPQRRNFPGRQIPVRRLARRRLDITKRLPKSADPCGRVSFGAIEDQRISDAGPRRLHISDKQMLFGRYMADHLKTPPRSRCRAIFSIRPRAAWTIWRRRGLGHTYLFRPRREPLPRRRTTGGVFRFNDDYFSGCDLGVKFHCYVPHQTVVNVTGGFTIGAGHRDSRHRSSLATDLSDDVSMVRGTHQIGLWFSGFKYQHSQKANVFAGVNFGL